MVKLYKKDKQYFWKFDRFHFFTESEKAGILTALNDSAIKWKRIESAEELKGGVYDMYSKLIKELEKSMEE